MAIVKERQGQRREEIWVFQLIITANLHTSYCTHTKKRRLYQHFIMPTCSLCSDSNRLTLKNKKGDEIKNLLFGAIHSVLWTPDMTYSVT